MRIIIIIIIIIILIIIIIIIIITIIIIIIIINFVLNSDHSATLPIYYSHSFLQLYISSLYISSLNHSFLQLYISSLNLIFIVKGSNPTVS